jgi:hypothetical protein
MPGPPRKLRPRGTLQYDKAPLSLEKLVDRLSERGLMIPDQDRASRYLRHIATSGSRHTPSRSSRAGRIICSATELCSTTCWIFTSSTAHFGY